MLVQVNEDKLKEVIEKVLTFPDDGSVEKAVIELASARQTLETAYRGLTDAMKNKMAEAGLQSVEGDMVRVSVSESGPKYKVDDIKEVQPDFLELKLDPKAVAEFEKENKRLPDHVSYAQRSQSCRITIKQGAND